MTFSRTLTAFVFLAGVIYIAAEELKACGGYQHIACLTPCSRISCAEHRRQGLADSLNDSDNATCQHQGDCQADCGCAPNQRFDKDGDTSVICKNKNECGCLYGDVYLKVGEKYKAKEDGTDYVVTCKQGPSNFEKAVDEYPSCELVYCNPGCETFDGRRNCPTCISGCN